MHFILPHQFCPVERWCALCRTLTKCKHIIIIIYYRFYRENRANASRLAMAAPTGSRPWQHQWHTENGEWWWASSTVVVLCASVCFIRLPFRSSVTACILDGFLLEWFALRERVFVCKCTSECDASVWFSRCCWRFSPLRSIAILIAETVNGKSHTYKRILNFHSIPLA